MSRVKPFDEPRSRALGVLVRLCARDEFGEALFPRAFHLLENRVGLVRFSAARKFANRREHLPKHIPKRRMRPVYEFGAQFNWGRRSLVAHSQNAPAYPVPRLENQCLDALSRQRSRRADARYTRSDDNYPLRRVFHRLSF